MSKDTPIEWCDSAVNPVMGCDGCELWMPEKDVRVCYAGQIHQVRAGNKGYADDFLIPKMFAGRMDAAARWSDLRGTSRDDKPWINNLPRLIFVSDMGDALSRSIPFQFLYDEVIRACLSIHGRRHQWLWLTKQPGRMAQFYRWLQAQGIEWPANLWAMTSITSKVTMGRARALARVEGARIHGWSIEPIYGDMDLDSLPRPEWVIVGGESSPRPTKATPTDVEQIRRVLQWCARRGIACFHKQVGSRPGFEPTPGIGVNHNDFARNPKMGGAAGGMLRPLARHGGMGPLVDNKGGDWSEWAKDLRVREFPIVAAA